MYVCLSTPVTSRRPRILSNAALELPIVRHLITDLIVVDTVRRPVRVLVSPPHCQREGFDRAKLQAGRR